MSCVLFSCAGWPFNRNESASFAHFLRSVSSTLSGVRRGETINFALICVFCVFVFLSRATLVIPPGQHLSLLPPLTLVGRRHTGTTLLQAQSQLKISKKFRSYLEKQKKRNFSQNHIQLPSSWGVCTSLGYPRVLGLSRSEYGRQRRQWREGATESHHSQNLGGES